MKAREALKLYDDDKKLKVGSKQSYFYIGNVGDFLENIKFISGELYAALEKRMLANKKEYETRLKNPPSVSEYCKMQEKGSRDFTANAYMEYINTWLDTTRKRLITWENAQETIESFKPLDKREARFVRESDKSVDAGCLILILEGDESGAYWTTDEDAPGSVKIGSGVVIQ